ncbi:hypothetical protein HF324_20355 [Chitinophaga oryzae]|uniref:Uncharacterized protein n=1 Tax=Chitinophaga oryzae TaxID=2725414 RepID=A0AAE7D8S4_9BACT|nr:hypothetical protein [Chitinophaga oryzae]QJB33557.1 hypothetical protein HF329_20475 [Chitinophaga oryzae]QJB40079.1 hypothetical protein HF324_20355 [Chitinophaga oryzae]
MKKHLLLSISLLSGLLAHAQQTRLARVNVWYDTTAVAELYDRVPLGLELVYTDSSSRQTTGMLRGNLRWNKIQVSSSNGNIQNGVLYFNRLQLAKDHYRITITVNGEGNTPLSNTITLPYLVGMRFNHYTDSIKRNIRYYMNVEGKFSSGRVLPLDTVQLRFRTSAGAVIGQDVLVEQKDTAKAVLMEAWYKPNPDLYIRSEVPIKIMPDPDLPPPANRPGSRGRRQ